MSAPPLRLVTHDKEGSATASEGSSHVAIPTSGRVNAARMRIARSYS